MKKNELEQPMLAVDVVVLAVVNGSLVVFLREREKQPFEGAPALPGVAVKTDETLAEAAKRALIEKAGFSRPVGVFLDQLAAFDELYRDPRGRTISVAYMGISKPSTKVPDLSEWMPVSGIVAGSLPFDHNAIIDAAVSRLRGKLRYTNIAKGFLPQTFRIEDLQSVYEAILGRKVNRTNFRTKLMKIGLIEKVKALNDAVGKKGGRPPHLYRFASEMIEYAYRDFL